MLLLSYVFFNYTKTFPKKPAGQKWTGPIYLPGYIHKLLSQEAKDALQKYNVEAIQKFKTSRNLNETNLIGVPFIKKK